MEWLDQPRRSQVSIHTDGNGCDGPAFLKFARSQQHGKAILKLVIMK
jgi:hypothetical protein